MKILHLIFSTNNLSVSGVYLKGLKENQVEVLDFYFSKEGLKKYLEIFKCYWERRNEVDLIMVGQSSSKIVIFVRLFSLKKIIYNALCSEYERMIISRSVASKFSLKAYYFWLLDFLACRSADLVMLETQAQINFFRRIFKIRPDKCFMALTGINDHRLSFDPNLRKDNDFTVIFRGRLLPEAGFEHAVKAAKILEYREDIKFVMLAHGRELKKLQSLIGELNPKNLKLITDFLPDNELCQILQKAHLFLGQLSSHDRLNRTIPHKAFESLALKLPYLTARNSGVLELLKKGETCLVCNPADAKDLSEKIIWAKDHPLELEKIAGNGYKLYKERLTSKFLAKKLIERIKSFK